MTTTKPIDPTTYHDINSEMHRARKKFPTNRNLFMALAEEFGELAQAILQGDQHEIEVEALHTAVVAIRIYEEGIKAHLRNDAP